MRAFAVRSLRLRYRQTLLGVVWAVVQPLALLVPIALFLSDDTPTIDGVDFAASTLAALVAWSYLSAAVTAGSGSLVSEAILVRKSWFPREAPVVAAVASTLVDLGVRLDGITTCGTLQSSIQHALRRLGRAGLTG